MTLVDELRSWVGFPKKELDVLLENAADEIERLRASIKPTATGWIHEHNFLPVSDGLVECCCGAKMKARKS